MYYTNISEEMMRIVASMTTIPSRIDYIRPAIDSIISQNVQVEALEINIPYKCLRTNESYELPNWLSEIDRVKIYRTKDYGPITKVAPTLLRYIDDNATYIWSVDDDYSYPANQLELLCRYHSPEVHRILTRHGGVFDENGKITFLWGETLVSMFEGFGTVLYPPGCIGDDFLDYIEKTSENIECRKSDDVVLSHYFTRRNVPIYLCNRPSETEPFYPTGALSHVGGKDALSQEDGGHLERYKRVYETLNSTWPAHPSG